MKTLKCSFVAASILVAVGTYAQAPDASLDPTAAAKAHTEQLTKQLGLNADQAAKVEITMRAAAKEAAGVTAEGEARQKKVDAIYDRAYGEMSGALTPEQAQTLIDLRSKGEIKSGCCSVKSGCGDGKTAKAGCCAGKAHAEAPKGEPVQ